MTDVSAEQRQKAKTAAANAAVACNDLAVVLGAAGAVVVVAGVASGVGSFAGVGVGGVLAVGSFGAWWLGNRYQRLANDPPRDDFGVVTISAASVIDGDIPGEEPDATLARFVAQHFVLADSIGALVTSLERFDGATAAGDGASASSQADAMQSNAQAALAAQGAVLGLADPMNAAWSATIPTVDWSSVTSDQVLEVYRDSVGDAAAAPAGSLQTVLDSVGDLSEGVLADGGSDENPLLAIASMPDQPDVLFGQSVIDAL